VYTCDVSYRDGCLETLTVDSCAKAALHPLVMTTATHYGKLGVNCNALALGTVATAVWDFAPPDILPKIAAKNPRGVNATPAEAASALCWLASGDSSLLNGQIIHGDGGFSKHRK
jgi:gluconate 5-dehydrogenase